MILNTGSRTDIPAYYSKWFYNRIKEGSVLVRNPYYPEQVTRYRLSPDVVDCLCFCTKNPRPMLDGLDQIRQFHQFWFVTVTPYGKEIEPHVPDKAEVIGDLKILSKRYGIHAVSWRYDPVFITEKYSAGFHLKAFHKMAEELSGYVDNCVISFIDLYAKTKRNFPGVREVSYEDRKMLVREFVQIGKEYGITIRMCCEGTEYAQYGADVSGCMTQDVIERAIGYTIDVPKELHSVRGKACSCLLGNDIGAYNTCGHGCLYCYANEDQEQVRRNMKAHDPNSLMLVGRPREEDRIRDAAQKSYFDGQMRLPW